MTKPYYIAYFSMTREKGKGEGGELVEPVRKYWAQMSAMAADESGPVKLLGRPATSEPYTILIMILTIDF
jgi:hypothetical protein